MKTSKRYVLELFCLTWWQNTDNNLLSLYKVCESSCLAGEQNFSMASFGGNREKEKVPLAQLVERSAHNRVVVGSSPARYIG